MFAREGSRRLWGDHPSGITVPEGWLGLERKKWVKGDWGTFKR